MRKRLTFRKVNPMRFNHLLSESVDVNNGDIPEPIKTGQHSGVVICFPESERTNVSQQTIRGRENKKTEERKVFFHLKKKNTYLVVTIALLLIHDKGFNMITMVDIPTIVITETFENP